MRLYLDDIRPCPEGWTLARSVDEAIAKVLKCREKGEAWEAASLDHDLAEDHYGIVGYGEPPHTGTGLDFVDWMINEKQWPLRRPYVHSSNPNGRDRMRQAIERYGPYE